MIGTDEVILRLVIASILGGLVGIDREIHNRPAGLRTHILVTVGSALIMLVSMYGFEGNDPARLSAQVVSGIGFLGAGTILRNGNDVKGLTTAASIWVCGGIGLAIGNGYYLGGCITTGIVLFTLLSLGFIEKKLIQSKYKSLQIICVDRNGLLGEIGTTMANNNVTIKDIKIINDNKYDEEEDVEDSLNITIKLTLKIPCNFSLQNLENQLYIIKGVEKITLKR